MKPSLPLILLFVLKSDNLEQFIKELFPSFCSCARCLPALCMSFLSLATQYIDLARPVLQKRLKNDQTSQRTFRIFLVINIYLKGLAVGTPMVIFFKTMQEDDRWADVYDDDDNGDDDDGMVIILMLVMMMMILLMVMIFHCCHHIHSDNLDSDYNWWSVLSHKADRRGGISFIGSDHSDEVSHCHRHHHRHHVM